jgi:hypothetical protein
MASSPPVARTTRRRTDGAAQERRSVSPGGDAQLRLEDPAGRAALAVGLAVDQEERDQPDALVLTRAPAYDDLTIARLLTNEAHLQAMETVIPEPQYVAFLAPAQGMTVQQAWEEVAACAPPSEAPAPEAPDDRPRPNAEAGERRCPTSAGPRSGRRSTRWSGSSLASPGIEIRGRSEKLKINYRTRQEILTWAVPRLGLEPVTGLDDDADTLDGYRSPMHGRRPEVRSYDDRTAELAGLVETVREWLDAGVEPRAIGVAARSTKIANAAKEALTAAGIRTLSLTAGANVVRAGTMHKMKGLLG